MRVKVKKFEADSMGRAEKLGKELLRQWVQGGYDREFLEYSFIPYNGTDKESGVTILAMQGSPIRGFVVVDCLARRVRVFDSFFAEIDRIRVVSYNFASSPNVLTEFGYCPKIKTYNPNSKEDYYKGG